MDATNGKTKNAVIDEAADGVRTVMLPVGILMVVILILFIAGQVMIAWVVLPYERERESWEATKEGQAQLIMNQASIITQNQQFTAELEDTIKDRRAKAESEKVEIEQRLTEARTRLEQQTRALSAAEMRLKSVQDELNSIDERLAAANSQVQDAQENLTTALLDHNLAVAGRDAAIERTTQEKKILATLTEKIKDLERQREVESDDTVLERIAELDELAHALTQYSDQEAQNVEKELAAQNAILNKLKAETQQYRKRLESTRANIRQAEANLATEQDKLLLAKRKIGNAGKVSEEIAALTIRKKEAEDELETTQKAVAFYKKIHDDTIATWTKNLSNVKKAHDAVANRKKRLDLRLTNVNDQLVEQDRLADSLKNEIAYLREKRDQLK